MAMDDAGGARRQSIAAALAAELDRQETGSASRFDTAALAAAAETAMGSPPPADEGKRPDELNANNDG